MGSRIQGQGPWFTHSFAWSSGLDTGSTAVVPSLPTEFNRYWLIPDDPYGKGIMMFEFRIHAPVMTGASSVNFDLKVNGTSALTAVYTLNAASAANTWATASLATAPGSAVVNPGCGLYVAGGQTVSVILTLTTWAPTTYFPSMQAQITYARSGSRYPFST